MLEALNDAPDGLSTRELATEVTGHARIAKTIELLSVESRAPLVRLDGRWQRTAAPPADAFSERSRRLTDLMLAQRDQVLHHQPESEQSL